MPIADGVLHALKCGYDALSLGIVTSQFGSVANAFAFNPVSVQDVFVEYRILLSQSREALDRAGDWISCLGQNYAAGGTVEALLDLPDGVRIERFSEFLLPPDALVG
jgi:hypothetical protein